jgi:transcriptional regulator with XRE-family HTH domain
MAPVEARHRFAQNLRAERQRRGLSQEALGDACGLHRTEVSLLERALRDPRLSTITRLARALGIPAAALLDGIE